MKKDEVFFGKDGLTSTSARHICNITNEVKRGLSAVLNGVKFYNSAVSMPMSSKTEEMLTGQGYGMDKLQQIPDMLVMVGEINSLIAWLNEAIKAKESMMNEFSQVSFSMWLEDKGEVLKMPEFETKLEKPVWTTELVMPERPLYVDTAEANVRMKKLRDNNYYLSRNDKKYWISDMDVIESMDIKERNRLLELNSLVALYGKYIGQSEKEGVGPFLKARKEQMEKLTHEYDVKGQGADTVITHYTASVTSVDVDSVYFQLQAKHRELQAEYNGLVHKVELKVQEMFVEMQQQYQQDMTEYEVKLAEERKAYQEAMDKYDMLYATERQEFNKKMDEYNVRKARLTDEYKEWLSGEKQRIQALKIVIPNSLLNIYNKVKEQTR